LYSDWIFISIQITVCLALWLFVVWD